MRALLIQHLPALPDPVFVGRTLDGRFHVIWRHEILGSAESLAGALKLAAGGPLRHAEFGLLPRLSSRLDDWKLCTGREQPGEVRWRRRADLPAPSAPRHHPPGRSSTAAERLARVEGSAAKLRDAG